MDCNRVNDLITYYLDNELEDKEKSLFEEHIKDCVSCRSALDEITAIISLCKDISDEELPADFKENLHKKLLNVKVQVGSDKIQEQKKENRNNVVRFVRVISSFAAVVLVFVFLKGMIGFGGMGSSKTDMSMEAPKADAPKAEAMMEEPKREEMKANGEKSAEMKAASAQDSTESTVQMKEKDSAALSGGESGQSFGAESGGMDNSVMLKQDKATEQSASITAAKGSAYNIAAIMNRSTGVEIVTEKPDEAASEIKKLAAASNAEVYTGTATESEETIRALSDINETVMNFKISNSSYTLFEENLRKKYSEGSIKFDTIKINDVTNKIEELNIQNIDLENRINSLETEKTNNTKEVEALRTEKNKVQENIDSLVSNAEYTLVRIIIRKKP